METEKDWAKEWIDRYESTEWLHMHSIAERFPVGHPIQVAAQARINRIESAWLDRLAKA